MHEVHGDAGRLLLLCYCYCFMLLHLGAGPSTGALLSLLLLLLLLLPEGSAIHRSIPRAAVGSWEAREMSQVPSPVPSRHVAPSVPEGE